MRVQPIGGGAWQFFLSHKQSDSAAEALELTHHLGRDACWLDVHQDDCSVQAMENGVRNSKFFVCILSTGYLMSQYCMTELAWAFSFQKPVVLCYRHVDNIGALLQCLPSQFSSLSDINGIKLDRTHPRYFKVGVDLIYNRISQLGAYVAKTVPALQARAAQSVAAPPPVQYMSVAPGGMSATAYSSDPVERVLGRYKKENPLIQYNIVRSNISPGIGVTMIHEPQPNCFGCTGAARDPKEYVYDGAKQQFRLANKDCNDDEYYLAIDNAPHYITLKNSEGVILVLGGLLSVLTFCLLPPIVVCLSPGDNAFQGFKFHRVS